jgi:hypothetical protein
MSRSGHRSRLLASNARWLAHGSLSPIASYRQLHLAERAIAIEVPRALGLRHLSLSLTVGGAALGLRHAATTCSTRAAATATVWGTGLESSD